MFGVPGIAVAVSLFDPGQGSVALMVGFLVGGIMTKLFVPSLLAEWDRTGVPGLPRTREQQKVWEDEKEKRGLQRNLVPVTGVLIAAVLRTCIPLNLWLLIIPAGLGGLTAYFGCFAWLLYQRRKGGLDL
jgi:hypothetical protein